MMKILDMSATQRDVLVFLNVLILLYINIIFVIVTFYVKYNFIN